MGDAQKISLASRGNEALVETRHTRPSEPFFIPLLREEPAVYRQHGTGDERCLIGRQK